MYNAARLKDEEKCTGCGLCILACPEANAIKLIKIDKKVKKIEVCVRKCKGCGLCVEACPRHLLEVTLRNI